VKQSLLAAFTQPAIVCSKTFCLTSGGSCSSSSKQKGKELMKDVRASSMSCWAALRSEAHDQGPQRQRYSDSKQPCVFSPTP
jgi:hypothetical protein